MSLDIELEELLKVTKALEAQIEQQESRLMELDAHKKTLVKALTSREIATHFPASIEYNKGSQLIEVEDFYPFYIFNIGKICLDGNGIGIPQDYKILRRFMKTKCSNASAKDVFYTTTVLKRNETIMFLIKDDENNTWKGPNAFKEFSNSFPEPIPFRSIIDWLGLRNETVQKLMKSTAEYKEIRANPKTLDDYFQSKSNKYV